MSLRDDPRLDAVRRLFRRATRKTQSEDEWEAASAEAHAALRRLAREPRRRKPVTNRSAPLAVALLLGAVTAPACTPQQKAELKADEAIVVSDVHSGAALLLGAVAAAETNPALTQYAMSLVQAAVAKPGQTPPAAFLAAQQALSQGDLARAHAALATLVLATAPAPSPAPVAGQ